MPSIFIDESRSKQRKDKEILNTNIQRGKELIGGRRTTTMKPNVEELRKKYIDNPPEGMTSKDIRNMSEDELLDMD